MSKDDYPKDCHDCYKEGFTDGAMAGVFVASIVWIIAIVVTIVRIV